MQVGEAASENTASLNHDDDCYFCNNPEGPIENLNDLEDEDVDGLESAGIRFSNNASKLGTALSYPGDREVTMAAKRGGKAKRWTSRAAAHHLIPGNASLKNSTLMQYLHTDGMAARNIGYNINAAPNGVWLPGNYAIRPWGDHGEDAVVQPQKYATESIDEWKRQFHDAHTDYNSFVLDVLDKIAKKIKKNQTIWCPKAEEKTKGDHPLFALVNRLHTVSGRMKRMLVFPTAAWKSNVFTSGFSAGFMQTESHRSK
jgi:A nuclease family of the HNH/ENDO VII superfamily with conserved AHH